MNIIYSKGLPREYRPVVDKLLNEHLYICPLWLQRIYVGFDSTENIIASWELNQDYRRAHLTIGIDFLHVDDEMRRETIIHELIHSFTIPLKKVCCDAFNDLDVDERLGTVLLRRIDEVMEQVTQDFTYSLARK